jgi:hypothetical protein
MMRTTMKNSFRGISLNRISNFRKIEHKHNRMTAEITQCVHRALAKNSHRNPLKLI